MATEIAAHHLSDPRGDGTRARGDALPALDAVALRLLACAASGVSLIGLLVLLDGPSERNETLSWLLAFGVAIPAGLAIAASQARALVAAAPAAPVRALAAALLVLAAAFLLRRIGVGDGLHHLLLIGAATLALAAPWLAARLWRDPGDRAGAVLKSVPAAALGLTLLLFLPDGAWRPEVLLPALALAVLTVLLLLRLRGRTLSPAVRHALDACFCVVLALVVVQLPDLNLYSANVIIHHGFFLGPANDALHGRAMLGDAWSQYGVSLIDFLAVLFGATSIGFGTLALTIVALTVLQYLCAYAILRLAGVGLVLGAITMAVAVLGNLFLSLEAYLVFPSATPLRFGIPYLIIISAVFGARYPARARLARGAVLLWLGIAAVWSFETFVYCALIYGALVLVESISEGKGAWRRLLWGGFLGFLVSAWAVLVFSLLTLLLDGHVDWGPYLEYIQLYSSEGFSQLPVIFFSAGPLMGASIFASATTLLWLAHAQPGILAPPIRAALTGFTGFAIASFTYYIGRSHPNNLLILLVPVAALGALWIKVLMSPGRRWRVAAVAAIVFAGAMISVAAWPTVRQKGGTTALALALPGGSGSLRFSYDRLANNPVLDPAAPYGVRLLDRRLPPGEPALVLAEPDLTTEILVRSGRRNVLPISHPPEDVLIDSSEGRVLAAAQRIPAGTLLLTSPRVGEFEEVSHLELVALSALHRRFAFQLVEGYPGSLRLVRLVPKQAIVPAP